MLHYLSTYCALKLKSCVSIEFLVHVCEGEDGLAKKAPKPLFAHLLHNENALDFNVTLLEYVLRFEAQILREHRVFSPRM